MSREELDELVGDLRAWIEAAGLDGYTHEGQVDVSEPSAERPEARVQPRMGEWSTIATDARVSAAAVGRSGLDAIREEMGDCRRCGLCTGRRSIVFGVGDPQPKIAVIGEGPGAEEDRRGEPFVGPAGQMLDKMLEHVLGVTRAEGAYILNVVKCRPPNNRNPQPEEVAACRPFLEAQIDALKPTLILVLGSVAYKSLFDTSRGITSARGQWLSYKGIPTMATFHPAYLLRKPQDKRITFEDLKLVRARLDGQG